VEIFLGKPTSLNKLIFTNGAGDITTEPSVREIEVIQLDQTNTPIQGRPTIDYTLPDSATPKIVNFNAVGISGIYIKVISDNRPGVGTDDVSLNKVEFRQCAP
jgi:hypothetical protein